jgi:hypothetical protein
VTFAEFDRAAPSNFPGTASQVCPVLLAEKFPIFSSSLDLRELLMGAVYSLGKKDSPDEINSFWPLIYCLR